MDLFSIAFRVRLKTKRERAAMNRRAPGQRREWGPRMQPHEVQRLRLRLVETALRLPSEHLESTERLLASLAATPAVREDTPSCPAEPRDWPHAPLHRISEHRTYIVTAATFQKEHFFRGADRLTTLEAALLRVAVEANWHLEAWAVFSNHYHFVAHASPDA